MKVVSSVKIGEKHLAPLRQDFPQVEFLLGSSMRDVQGELSQAEVFITYGSDFAEEHLAEAPQLKWIQVFAAGVDELPLSALQRRRVLVTNARGVHAVPISEYVLGSMLFYVRRWPQLHENQKLRLWDRSVLFSELHGRTLCIVGMGAIGQRIAECAKTFGMHILGVSRSGRSVPFVDEVFPVTQLAQALPRCDFLVLILPSTPQTKELIGERELSLLPSHAVLINVARGDVVEEMALLRMLQEKKIGGAFLDVFTEEPLPPEHPFWTMENVWISPHSASLSPYYMKRCVEILRENLAAYLTGERIRNQVDLLLGY